MEKEKKFPPGYLEKANALVAAQGEVAIDPLPGPLAGAFAGAPIEALGFKLKPLTAAHFIVLHSLKSPICVIGKKEQKPEVEKSDEKKNAISPEELIEAFFVCVLSAEDAWALLCKLGRDGFRAEAMTKIAGTIGFMDLPKIEVAVVESLRRAFSTRINYAPTEVGDSRPFAKESVPSTVSDGGLAT